MPPWGFASNEIRRLVLSTLRILAGRRTEALRAGGGGGAHDLVTPASRGGVGSADGWWCVGVEIVSISGDKAGDDED